MPSKTKKQQAFMGAQLAQQRKTGSNKTGMKESQLREFAGSVGSLHDIDYHEDAAERKTVMNGEEGGTHPIHKGYDYIVCGKDRDWGEDGDEPKGAEMSANRDNGWGIHYGAVVDYFGPDTTYRAEEINVHMYGSDYDPSPLRDYYKDEKKGPEENNLRLIEEYHYSNIETPGYIRDGGLESSLAHGSVSYEKIPVDVSDSRSFKSQQYFRRAQDERDDDTVKVAGLDTKKGKDIR
jgi:hypothetical protein